MSAAIDPSVALFLANCGSGDTSAAQIGRSSADKARRRRIGERVRALREAKGWSQNKLAWMTHPNLKERTIAEIEAGRSLKSRGQERSHLLDHIAAVLGVPREWLEREEEATL